MLGSPFNISTTAEASEFKFGTQLRFAKSHHKITPGEKCACPWAREHSKIRVSPLIFLQRLKLATSYFVCWFSKVYHKTTPRGKSGRGPKLGKLPKLWGSPLIFLQRLKLATSRLAGRWALPRPITKSHQKKKMGMVRG